MLEYSVGSVSKHLYLQVNQFIFQRTGVTDSYLFSLSVWGTKITVRALTFFNLSPH